MKQMISTRWVALAVVTTMMAATLPALAQDPYWDSSSFRWLLLCAKPRSGRSPIPVWSIAATISLQPTSVPVWSVPIWSTTQPTTGL